MGQWKSEEEKYNKAMEFHDNCCDILSFNRTKRAIKSISPYYLYDFAVFSLSGLHIKCVSRVSVM